MTAVNPVMMTGVAADMSVGAMSLEATNPEEAVITGEVALLTATREVTIVVLGIEVTLIPKLRFVAERLYRSSTSMPRETVRTNNKRLLLYFSGRVDVIISLPSQTYEQRRPLQIILHRVRHLANGSPV
jgi:hypothetical protein